MRFPLRYFTIFLLAATLFSMVGCSLSNDNATAATQLTAPSTKEASAALYIEAANSVLSAHNVTMQLQLQTRFTSENESFSKRSTQTLSVMNQGTDYMIAALEETLQMGSYSTTISERYAQGMQYYTINGSRFVSPITAQDYLDRFVPGRAFDSSIYAKIFSEQIESGIKILFQSPAAAESWAVPENSRFVSAEGQALLSEDGQLAQCSYTVNYTVNNINVAHTAQITYDTTTLPSIDIPSSSEDSITLTDPRVPRLLEEVCGYLMQTQSISTNTVHIINSEAFGISRTQSSNLHLYDSNGLLMALRQSNVELLNQTHGDEATQSFQVERFIDGEYTLDNGMVTPAELTQVTADQMRDYCRELLVTTLLLPEYITNVTVSETDNAYRLDFAASEALAQLIGSNTCQTLYNDPQLLNDLASDYQTREISAYLEVDKNTALPLAAGIHYTGMHTIQQTVYALSADIDQTYTPNSTVAYDSIANYTFAAESENADATDTTGASQTTEN